jgi:ribosomal protein S8
MVMKFNIINLVKLNLIYKKRKIRIKLNKYEYNLVKFLIKINLIKFIKKNNKNYDIFFNYIYNKPIFRNIKNISKPSRPVFISNKKLKFISNKYKSIFLLNTNKGILTNLEAINMKVGGLIIFKL